MESTFNDNGQTIRSDAKMREANPAETAPKPREEHGQEVSNLTADVQELFHRVAHVADPEIARLRTKIERGLTAAKKALADGTDQVQRHAKDAMAAGDSYVREQPWQAVGISAAVGLVVGFLVARRAS
jgi:ElaB/YqjD/DUF883 family membrane-anchored ribosome-binding protein